MECLEISQCEQIHLMEYPKKCLQGLLKGVSKYMYL